MFRSTLIRLTVIYTVILVVLSISMSAVIYQVSTHELGSRLFDLQRASQIGTRLIERPDIFQYEPFRQSPGHLLTSLFYFNISVLLLGGIGSYFLARHSLKPLERAHLATTRFTSDASHELRTPLASMQSEIEVALMDDNVDTQELKEVLKSNLEEVGRLTKLSNVLLSLARLEEDKLEMIQLDAADVVRDSALTFKLPPERLVISGRKRLIVRANEPTFHELIRILMDNALKYSPADSTVTVKLRQDQQHRIIEIANGGPGISKEAMPHIFKRFYRGDDSRSKKNQEGFGIGLSLAHRIVEVHHGSITITSIPDELTTVVVSLSKPN